ncbi:hypothetical protein F5883DRAFT_662154, partial [Diaporthe sp. PMI_573]
LLLLIHPDLLPGGPQPGRQALQLLDPLLEVFDLLLLLLLHRGHRRPHPRLHRGTNRRTDRRTIRPLHPGPHRRRHHSFQPPLVLLPLLSLSLSFSLLSLSLSLYLSLSLLPISLLPLPLPLPPLLLLLLLPGRQPQDAGSPGNSPAHRPRNILAHRRWELEGAHPRTQTGAAGAQRGSTGPPLRQRHDENRRRRAQEILDLHLLPLLVLVLLLRLLPRRRRRRLRRRRCRRRRCRRCRPSIPNKRENHGGLESLGKWFVDCLSTCSFPRELALLLCSLGKVRLAQRLRPSRVLTMAENTRCDTASFSRKLGSGRPSLFLGRSQVSPARIQMLSSPRRSCAPLVTIRSSARLVISSCLQRSVPRILKIFQGTLGASSLFNRSSSTTS